VCLQMLRGIDVSHHNGSVDWAALKTRYGITWGAAKATEGAGFKDAQFGANWRKMKAAGLVRMAYSFAHPDSDPSDDAHTFLSYVEANGLEPTDIMVMDMEGNSNNLPMLQVRDWLAGWADAVTKATGRKPFLYCGSGYIANNATKDLRSHYAAWWFPRYSTNTWPAGITGYPASNNWGGAPDIWQFSQSFGGGSMDANVANMTLDDLKTRGVVKPSSKPPVTPPVVVTPPPTTTKDIIDMSTEAEVAQAVEDGMDHYNARLYSDKGTLGIWHAQEVAYRAAHLAALEAQTAALQNLADALKPKV
jgi:GH25 family lysozyme M1 (1,4-beta-N-acetylmuramidase)